MEHELTHINEKGEVCMVNVSSKPVIKRVAKANGFLCAQKSTIDAIMSGELPKGEPISVARIAGIQAAKLTSTLVPLCHTIPIEHADIAFNRSSDTRVEVIATMTTHSKTGIEMEALNAVSISLINLWDMAKAIDSSMAIEDISIVSKEKFNSSITDCANKVANK